jgi:hypothetical protein
VPILPPKQRQKLGHRLWGYVLVCGAIGFYIAGAPLWLVLGCVAVGVAIMLVRPAKRVEDAAGDDATRIPPAPPPGRIDARPIEPAPLLPPGVAAGLLIAVAIAGYASWRASRSADHAFSILPWSLVTATADAPEPLAGGDVVLIYRWQSARDLGQFTTLLLGPGSGTSRLVVIAAGDPDSLATATDAPVPTDPVAIAIARPDSGGVPCVRLAGRADLHGVGVGVVWPLDRRRSLP